MNQESSTPLFTEALPIKRALVSVSDKEGVVELCRFLVKNKVEILSTGGTKKLLDENSIPSTSIEKITKNPESFGGRMKTLSFEIGSSLLFRRNHDQDLKEAKQLGIEPIDLVVCNLYPFEKVASESSDLGLLIENIDIGGPTMIRAAAKNHQFVCVLTDPKQYKEFENAYSIEGKLSFEDRQNFALSAFMHSANYEFQIANKLSKVMKQESFGELLNFSNASELRYGENAHQWAKLVPEASLKENRTLASAIPIQGKKLSYNNYLDADAALRCTSDLKFSFPKKASVSIVKHANPCGACVSSDLVYSLKNAWDGDPISSFGSIICFSEEMNLECADFLEDKFVEVLIAPKFSEAALEKLSKKKNLRLIQIPILNQKDETMIRKISGGWVIQNEDEKMDTEFQVVSKLKFDNSHIDLFKFGSIVTKHLKSNAISLVTNECLNAKMTDSLKIAGVGMGNPNRLISTEQAIAKAKENSYNLGMCTLVSDAFFPFKDNVELAASEGIKTIIQPGGSIKDEEVIEASDKNSMRMIFTGTRHFRH